MSPLWYCCGELSHSVTVSPQDTALQLADLHLPLLSSSPLGHQLDDGMDLHLEERGDTGVYQVIASSGFMCASLSH